MAEIKFGDGPHITEDMAFEAKAQAELNTAATRDYDQAHGDKEEPQSTSYDYAKIYQAMGGLSDDDMRQVAEINARQALNNERLRRNRIAEGFAFALITSPHLEPKTPMGEIASAAAQLADALIAELEK